ncbi:pyruvate kinase [bacterium]|nr:pyruvate kinase [bacterium]
MTARKAITKSKIVCTLGPASSTAEKIKELSDIGMDCTRINFSHGTREDKIELFNRIRKTDNSLAILCDIQGPKIRIGLVKEGGVLLLPGKKIVVTTEEVIGDENRITLMYPKLPEEIRVGELIYINDGIVCLRVEKTEGCEITCTILSGGIISSRKGVNLPSTEISLKVPTEKDIEDLKLIAELDPEFVAVSFVGTAEDVLRIRSILKDFGNDRIKLISKIERPIALENFDAILKVSDGIMVARGDLGVEIPPQEVIPAQKRIINRCNIEGKPVIVATQMLESMVQNPIATRAEVSDVYNAIMDGADAVMLSAETASGKYPAEAVTVMEKIIKMSESMIPFRDPDKFDSDHETTSEIIGHLVSSACKEFRDINYTEGKIVCLTQGGHSARMISKYRPSIPILGISCSERTVREMRLLWGLEPLLITELVSENSILLRIKTAVKICYQQGFLDIDENVIVSGNMSGLAAHTNMVAIFNVREFL